MGNDGGAKAVVDQRCRSAVVENLWVIDGSILPVVQSRPHATIVMPPPAAEFVE